jgi:hypothetical protein
MQDNQYVRVRVASLLKFHRVGPSYHTAKDLFLDNVVKETLQFVPEDAVHKVWAIACCFFAA